MVRYHRIEEFPLHSRVLGLDLRVEGDVLRLYDPKTGKRLPTPDEVEIARRAEAEGRRAAEERAAALEAELERLRAERRRDS